MLQRSICLILFEFANHSSHQIKFQLSPCVKQIVHNIFVYLYGKARTSRTTCYGAQVFLLSNCQASKQVIKLLEVCSASLISPFGSDYHVGLSPELREAFVAGAFISVEGFLKDDISGISLFYDVDVLKLILFPLDLIHE